MHIGLFGGTFNPVHIGHLRAALEVVEKFPLDECYLVPSATPPHKAAGDMVDANIRYDMICRAVAGQAGLKVSDIELKRAGPSYTVDTIRLFREKLPDIRPALPDRRPGCFSGTRHLEIIPHTPEVGGIHRDVQAGTGIGKII